MIERVIADDRSRPEGEGTAIRIGERTVTDCSPVSEAQIAREHESREHVIRDVRDAVAYGKIDGLLETVERTHLLGRVVAV